MIPFSIDPLTNRSAPTPTKGPSYPSVWASLETPMDQLVPM